MNTIEFKTKQHIFINKSAGFSEYEPKSTSPETIIKYKSINNNINIKLENVVRLIEIF